MTLSGARHAGIEATTYTQRSRVRGIAEYMGSKTPFRADIEGLRAVAVVAVVLFHAGVPGITGGFVGVDVFFVISGFLISDQLVRELRTQERISYVHFYSRRARRLVPLAGLVLVATGMAAALTMPPLRALEVLRDVAAASVMMANWNFVWLNTDYFAAAGNESPVLHYWSLAVEEQFYLVWPALLSLLAVMAFRRRWPLLSVLMIGIVLASGASLSLSLAWSVSEPSLAYMSVLTRGWQFGVGALLALSVPVFQHAIEGHKRLGVRILQRTCGWMGLATIAYSVVRVSETGYPGVAALIPTAGTAAVVFAGIAGPDGVAPRGGVGSVLSTRPMRFLGQLSFGLYLWHWSLLILSEARFGEQPWPVQLAWMVVATGLALITLRLVENPIRHSAALRQSWGRSFSVGALAAILPLCLSLGFGVGVLRVQTNGATTDQLLAIDLPSIGRGESTLLDGEFQLTAVAARRDYPALGGPCIADYDQTLPLTCDAFEGTGPDVVLFGDSHAHQWADAFADIAQQRDWNLDVLTKVYCTPSTRDVYSEVVGGRYTDCDLWRESALSLLENRRPDLVVIVGATFAPSQNGDAEKNDNGWVITLDRLGQAGIPVVYVRDNPHPGFDIPTCVSVNRDLAACDTSRAKAVFPDETASGMASGQRDQVAVVDLSSAICGTEVCPAVREGIVTYRDDNHLTRTLTLALRSTMDTALQQTGLLPPNGQAAQPSDIID